MDDLQQVNELNLEEAEEHFEMFVPNVSFEKIQIKNLVSSQDYQRGIYMNHVKRAVEHFDVYQINPVKVSRRNGINYVFNGQHTIEMVALASGSRETPVWCMIYDDLYYEHEADIFANQQKFVKNLQPYEIFIANVEAGNQKQLLIKDLVESYNMTIGAVKGAGVIGAVASLENIFDKYGYHVLDRTLRLCIATWEGDVDSFSGNMLKGIARLVACYGEAIDDEIFKDKVGALSVKQIGRNAKERRAGSLGYAEALFIAYNTKCKKPLRFTKLYERISPVDNIEDDFEESDEDIGEGYVSLETILAQTENNAED